MDVTSDADLRTPPGFDKAVRVSEIMSAMRPGWSALHDCVLPGMDGLSAARVALVLLHPAVGVAVVNVGTEPIPDGVAGVGRKLRLAGFEARFPGWLPVVQPPVAAAPLALLESLLDRTFQLERPIDLPGGDAWVRAARDALSGGSTASPEPRICSERASAPAGLARRSTADPQPTLPAATPEPSWDRRARPGLAGLLWFWMAVIAVGGAGAAVLQVLGPPEPAGHPPLAALAPPPPAPQTPPPAAAPTVSPAPRTRTVASGMGARDPIIGTGTDDATDALDRRVEVHPAAANNCAT